MIYIYKNAHPFKKSYSHLIWLTFHTNLQERWKSKSLKKIFAATPRIRSWVLFRAWGWLLSQGVAYSKIKFWQKLKSRFSSEKLLFQCHKSNIKFTFSWQPSSSLTSKSIEWPHASYWHKIWNYFMIYRWLIIQGGPLKYFASLGLGLIQGSA